jgi:NAD(P)H-hydrate repair Nnr-like enzyme with NAD(P)H-hydrate dehydratase domain
LVIDSSPIGNAQRQEEEVSKAVGAIEHWLPRFDVMVIGPGLGRDAWVHATVTQVCELLTSMHTLRFGAFTAGAVGA